MKCPKCGEHIDFDRVPIGQMPTDEEMKIIKKMRQLARRFSMDEEPVKEGKA